MTDAANELPDAFTFFTSRKRTVARTKNIAASATPGQRQRYLFDGVGCQAGAAARRNRRRSTGSEMQRAVQSTQGVPPGEAFIAVSSAEFARDLMFVSKKLPVEFRRLAYSLSCFGGIQQSIHPAVRNS